MNQTLPSLHLNYSTRQTSSDPVGQSPLGMDPIGRGSAECGQRQTLLLYHESG
ncbi:hypothetical protein [Corynebacterium parakroppenstedtii]|uniref:hypothetical protein n=1 Tax=Corynebacterium parakroppenstedtii TaxID=2828363 RepID=UPI001EF132EE|nr:hypothetical protein [Corynebacterium parakroppenstedtii]MCF7183490.1 hypothetical protein [Corynebacterium parakroppenstedtii]